MRKNAWLGVLVGCGVVLSVFLALRARRTEEADALTERARHLLRVPIAQAPSLRDLRAREARELLEEAEALVPSAARRPLFVEARGIELFTRGEYARAGKLVADAKSREPALRVVFAAAALARGDAHAAQAALEGLPEEPRVWLLRSDLARAMGRPDLALAAAERGIALDPGPAAGPFYERRGLAHELLGDRTGAQTDLEHAVQLDKRSTGALLALGRMHRSAGELSAAVLAFHAAAQRNPGEAEAWLGSGVCRQALGDYTSARADLERAAELSPTHAEPLIALADLDLAEKQMLPALRRFRAALLLDPHSALGHLKLGNALMRVNAVADARTHYASAISERPDLAAAHNGLGAALLSEGALEQAERELQTATRLDPADARPWLNLARLYKQRGDEPQLTAAMSHARERDPQLALAAAH